MESIDYSLMFRVSLYYSLILACKFDQMVISIIVVPLVYNVNLFINKKYFYVFVAFIYKRKHFLTTI